jgi:endonuclease I
MIKSEHVCPKSICGVSTSPAGPGTDIHSLRAEEVVNTQRSTKDFFEGGTAVLTATSASRRAKHFEPPDGTKAMPHALIFTCQPVTSTTLIIDGDGSVTGSTSIEIAQRLELWNDIDAVDAEEIHQNKYDLQDQGNRNSIH